MSGRERTRKPEPLCLDLEQIEVRMEGRQILRPTTLRVKPGEFVALVGPNGAGKTTLLRAALGLVPTSVGSVRIGGVPLASMTPQERARRAAWMPQEEFQSENLSVAEFVALGRYPYLGSYLPERPEDLAAVSRAMWAADVAQFADRGIWSLSGGERQRALYARALAQEAPLLLLDEPTSHLDMNHQLDLLTKLSEFRSRENARAVVTALHDLNLASRFADRVVWMNHGQVVADGTPGGTVTFERVLQVFSVSVEIHRQGPNVYVLPTSTPVGPRPPGDDLVLPRVHVVCGGGSGTEVLYALSEENYLVSAGPIHLLDSDQETCENLGFRSIVEVPFTPISEPVRAEYRAVLSEVDAIVLAPVMVGPGNLANLSDLLPFASAKPVFLYGGSPRGPRDFTGGKAAAAYDQLRAAGGIEVDGVSRLLELLRQRLVRPVGRAPIGLPSHPSDEVLSTSLGGGRP